MAEISSVSFCIKESDFNEKLVSTFHSTIESDSFFITSANVGHAQEETSVAKAVEHNQQMLNEHFSGLKKLTFSHDFLPVMIEGTEYSWCRLRVSIVPNFVCFTLNVLETEVEQYGYDDLKALSKSVITTMKIEELHTSGEDREASIEVLPDRWLAVEYFGYFRGSTFLDKDFCKFTELNGGFFIEYKS